MEWVRPVSDLDSPLFSTSRMYRLTLLCVLMGSPPPPPPSMFVRFPDLGLTGDGSSVRDRCLIPIDDGGGLVLDGEGLVGDLLLPPPPPMRGLGLVGDLSMGDLPASLPSPRERRDVLDGVFGDIFRGVNITFAPLGLADLLWGGTSGGSLGSVVALSGRLLTDVVDSMWWR